ncbi:sensor histidine kinase [Tahibacter amnicola]|uniref:Histidine kinase n=1 Tax=Tahibacter amnicola TaxID=2976241 RepID=A0ABY6BPU7_9GAMM|nr:histidine kinase [Tahibacter amnicola]UXI70586.1 histidine kinase [Tahibacter amnicola]
MAATLVPLAAPASPDAGRFGQTPWVNTRHFLPIAAAFWTVFGLVTGIQVWISMLDHGHSVPWLLVYYLFVWLAWLGPTYVIAWLVRQFPPGARRRGMVAAHIAAAIAIAVVHVLYEVGLMLWMRPYDRRTATFSEVDFLEILFTRVPLEWILYCLTLGCVLAFEYYERYHERALRAAQLERSVVDAKLHALELQLQPHFLFNTLNAVAGLVRSQRNEQAVTMIAGLADLLRYSLDQAGRQRVPLAEEIEMLKRYLEIEMARFSDRVTYRVSVIGAAGKGMVPNLILQPLVENAVRHGIANVAAGGSIELEAEHVDERLQIRLRNTGTLAVDPVEGIGLRNTRERLRNLYGEAATFTLSAGEGTVLATLDLPWETAA